MTLWGKHHYSPILQMRKPGLERVQGDVWSVERYPSCGAPVPISQRAEEWGEVGDHSLGGQQLQKRPAAKRRVVAGPVAFRHPDRMFYSCRLPEFHFLKQWLTAAQLAPLMTPIGVQAPQLRFCPMPAVSSSQDHLGSLGPAPRDTCFLARQPPCCPGDSSASPCCAYSLPPCALLPDSEHPLARAFGAGMSRERGKRFLCSEPVPTSLLFYVQRTRRRGFSRPSGHRAAGAGARSGPGSRHQGLHFQFHPLSLQETMSPPNFS